MVFFLFLFIDFSFICSFLKIDVGEDEESEGSDSECNENLELSKITEMRLVPSDPNQCILHAIHIVHVNSKYSCFLGESLKYSII